MKVVTWNVNSIRMRMSRVRQLLVRHAPDLVCLQELKVTDAAFPGSGFAELGYSAEVHGQPGRNGVALLSRGSIADVARGFPGDPVPDQARVISGTLDGARVVCAYVVNGRAVGTPEHELKLRWLDAFVGWIGSEHDPTEPVLVVGDFNVAPEDRDVHDPDLWRGQNLCSEPERERMRALHRAVDPEPDEEARGGHERQAVARTTFLIVCLLRVGSDLARCSRRRTWRGFVGGPERR